MPLQCYLSEFDKFVCLFRLHRLPRGPSMDSEDPWLHVALVAQRSRLPVVACADIPGFLVAGFLILPALAGKLLAHGDTSVVAGLKLAFVPLAL